MALAIGDVLEILCGECGATLRYQVHAQPIAIFIGAPNSPVHLTPLDRQPDAGFEGCPQGRDDCAAITAALARLHEVPEYAKWRKQPDVANWYDQLDKRNQPSG